MGTISHSLGPRGICPGHVGETPGTPSAPVGGAQSAKGEGAAQSGHAVPRKAPRTVF